MFRIIPEGLAYREHVLLKNGQGLLLRPATPQDVPLVEDFMQRVSRESLQMRFMAAVSQVPRTVIEELCNGDFTDAGCLLAVDTKEHEPKVVGLGNYIGMNNGRSAEVAFLVADEYQGLGISTILLERLAGLAAANGYIELEAEVLPDNQPMINVFKSSGFEVHQVWASDTVHIELPVNKAVALWERAGLRERIAVANSLLPLMRPKAVAVIGASRDESSIGNMIFRNILNNGYKGTLYPINPEADSVRSVKAYASVDELPEPIDLAVIAVPAEKVQQVAEHAIHHGAKALVVVTAGFAEAGPEGNKRQQKLIELVKSHGVRLLGPSCLGLMNTDPDIRLNASLAPRLPLAGTVGFFSHSAALGLVILEYATEKGLGFTTFISAGNRADVSGNDFLLYWEEDPKTKLAVLYLETFGNPRRFVRIARRMSYKKPILCVKSARSKAGRKTAEAKSGTPSVGAAETEALFHQTGVILAETLEELFDVALVLAHQPLPRGNRVTVIANSAGMATIFADASEANGLSISGPGVVNLGAFTSPADYEQAVYQAVTSDEVDAILVGFACVGACGPEPVADAIRRGVKKGEQETDVQKPVLLCLMGAAGTVALMEENESTHRQFPAFRFPESASRALGKVVRYAQFKKQPAGKLVWYDDVQGDQARKEVKKLLPADQSDQVIDLSAQQAAKILSFFGLRIKKEARHKMQPILLRVKPDPLFGPLIQLQDSRFSPVVRITPLTERDIEETLEEIGLNDHPGLS
ncbi:MAG TPA: GNAT family N-acetyltransferase, partial [Caldithrix abyssi]|nr:GNAT family N-acetyltransferase [Caldithrix abyssi]